MSDLHPHWQATGGDAPASPPVTGAGPTTSMPTKVPVRTMSVSRKPAAIAGIVVMLAVGYAFVQGVDQLTGQLQNQGSPVPAATAPLPTTSLAAAPAAMPKSLTIHITDKGPQPPAATIAGGGIVTIINDREFPQIIRSKVAGHPILDSKNQPILSPALFKDDTYQFTLALGQQAGAYTYTSDTTPDLLGTLTIGASAGAPKAAAPVQTNPINNPSTMTNPQPTTPFGSLDGIKLPTGLGTDYVPPSNTSFTNTNTNANSTTITYGVPKTSSAMNTAVVATAASSTAPVQPSAPAPQPSPIPTPEASSAIFCSCWASLFSSEAWAGVRSGSIGRPPRMRRSCCFWRSSRSSCPRCSI